MSSSSLLEQDTNSLAVLTKRRDSFEEKEIEHLSRASPRQSISSPRHSASSPHHSASSPRLSVASPRHLLTDFSSAFNFGSAISAFGNLTDIVNAQGKIIKNLEQKLGDLSSTLSKTNLELDKNKSLVKEHADRIKKLNRIIESNELEDLNEDDNEGEENNNEDNNEDNSNIGEYNPLKRKFSGDLNDEEKEAIDEQISRENELKIRPLTSSKSRNNSRPTSSSYGKRQQDILNLKEDVENMKNTIQSLHEKIDNYDRSLFGARGVDPSNFVSKPVTPYIAFQRSSVVMDQPPHLLIGLNSNGSRPNSSGIANINSPTNSNNNNVIEDMIPEGEYEDSSLAYNLDEASDIDQDMKENDINFINKEGSNSDTTSVKSISNSARDTVTVSTPVNGSGTGGFNDSALTSKPLTGRSKNNSRAQSRNTDRNKEDIERSSSGIPRYPSSSGISSTRTSQDPFPIQTGSNDGSSSNHPLSSRGSSRQTPRLQSSRPLTSRPGSAYPLRRTMSASNLPLSLTRERIERILLELANRGRFLIKNKQILEEEKKNYASQSFRQRIDLLEINLTETKRKVENQNNLIKKLKNLLYDNVLSKNFTNLLQFFEIFDNSLNNLDSLVSPSILSSLYPSGTEDLSQSEKAYALLENNSKNILKFLLNDKLLDTLLSFDPNRSSPNKSNSLNSPSFSGIPAIEYVNSSSSNNIDIPILKSISQELDSSFMTNSPVNAGQGARSRASSYASNAGTSSSLSEQHLNQVILTVKNTLFSPFEKAIDQEIREYRNKLIELSSDMLSKNDLNNMLKISTSNMVNNDNNYLKLVNVIKFCLENYYKSSNTMNGSNQGNGMNQNSYNSNLNFEDGSLIEFFKTNDSYKQYIAEEINQFINSNENVNKILLNIDELNSSYTANLIRLNKFEEQMSLIYDKLLYNENMREILTLEHNKLEQKRIDDYEQLMILQKKISNISLDKLIEELKTVQINLLNRPSSDDIKGMINSIEETFKNHLGENVVGLRSLVHEVALRLHNKADRTDIRDLINRKLNQIEADLLLHEKGGDLDLSSSLTSRCLGCGQFMKPSSYLNFPLNTNNGPAAYVSSSGSKKIVFDDDSTILSKNPSEIQSILTGQTGLKPLHLPHNSSTPLLLNAKKKDKNVIQEPLPNSNVRKAKLQAHIQNSVKLAMNSAENYGITSSTPTHNYYLDSNEPSMSNSFSLPEISPNQSKKTPLIQTGSHSRAHSEGK